MCEEVPETRPRDIYDVILEGVWDAAVGSVWSNGPQRVRRAALEKSHGMLSAVVPKG